MEACSCPRPTNKTQSLYRQSPPSFHLDLNNLTQTVFRLERRLFEPMKALIWGNADKEAGQIFTAKSE